MNQRTRLKDRQFRRIMELREIVVTHRMITQNKRRKKVIEQIRLRGSIEEIQDKIIRTS